MKKTFSATKNISNIFDKYLRYVDYISASQLYLKDNFFLEKKIKIEHIKERILGHWGTVPGLNFLYAHLNYLICKHTKDKVKPSSINCFAIS